MRVGHALIICLLGTSVACANEEHPRDAELLRQIGAAGCNPRVRVLGVTPDTLSKDAACRLATASLNYLGGGGGERVGILSADTSRLSSVLVKSAEVDRSRRRVEYYWEVTFANPGRAVSIVVRINRATGVFQASAGAPIDTTAVPDK